MPHLLIIAYYFPPWGMGGVQRASKFAKYLPEFGWDVTVITSAATGYYNRDSSLLDDLPKTVSVERIDHPDSTIAQSIGPIGPIRPILKWLSSWRDFPDRRRAFAVLAAKRARELMKEKPFDALLTTSPPPSVHLAGLELKREIPWISDFRDPWQALSDDYGPTLFHRLKNSALHKRVLKSADAVVAVTPELRKHFENNCGGSSVTVIRNGYDEADFNGITAQPWSSSTLRVVIPGTFSRFSDPRPILRGLAAYRALANSRQIRITHVGATMGFNLSRVVAESGLTDVFHDLGYVEHRDAIRAMLDSDLLLLSYADSQVTDVSVPGRIYEMLRAQRAIIAAVPTPSALANLLAPLDACEIVPPNDVEALANAVERAATIDGGISARPVSQVKQFERREETRQLSELCLSAMKQREGK